jgi:hypothetical protein
LQDVTLDFFGCAVKAADLNQHLSSMSLLAKRIDALTAAQQDPAASFRLEAAAVPPAAKWGKAIGWTPRDDAALLLGVYYHGLGHWEEVIGDERLGLQGKLGCVLAGREDGSMAGAAAAAGDKGNLQPKGEGWLLVATKNDVSLGLPRGLTKASESLQARRVAC